MEDPTAEWDPAGGLGRCGDPRVASVAVVEGLGHPALPFPFRQHLRGSCGLALMDLSGAITYLATRTESDHVRQFSTDGRPWF